MYVRSIEGPSTIDWIGKLVAVVYTQGCNFNCPYCQNSVLIPPPRKGMKSTEPEEILKKVDEDFGSLINGVLLTGGEPTLQEDLVPVLRELSSKYDLCMDTNGSNPDMLRNALPLLKKLDMDAKVAFERYREVGCAEPEKVKESFTLALNLRIPMEVRTTFAYPLLSFEDIKAIAQFLSSNGFMGFYVLQQYDPNPGVRQFFRKKLKQPPLKEIYDYARWIKIEYGIKMAVRSRLEGYVEV